MYTTTMNIMSSALSWAYTAINIVLSTKILLVDAFLLSKIGNFMILAKDDISFDCKAVSSLTHISEPLKYCEST